MTSEASATRSRLPAWITPRRALLALYALAFAFRRFAHADITDDAYITFVYARNLVEGAGFVFNPGEAVYGTTSPVFGLFTALGIRLGFQPWTWVLAWDVVWQALILWRLRQLMEQTGAGRWFWLAGLTLLIAAMDTLPVAGMETGPYLLAILSALATLRPGTRPWVPVTWAVGAACLRPDGCVIVAVAVAFAVGPLLRHKEWRASAIACMPLLGLVAFAGLTLALFGTVVPHSMQAKALNTAAAPFEATLAYDLLRFGWGWFGRPQWLAFVGVAAFAAHGWRREHWPLTAFVVGYVAFFVLGKAPRFNWYMTPITVLWYAWSARGVGEGLAWISARLAGREGTGEGGAGLRVAALVSMLLLFGFQARIYLKITAREALHPGVRTDLKGYRDAADYIRSQDDAPYVAAHEIGTLGWFLRGRIFDMEGLVSPAALRLRAEGKVDRLLEESGAPWFVHPYWMPWQDDGGKPEGLGWLDADAHFAAIRARGFEPVAWFDCPVDRWRTVVFRRNESAGGG